MNKTNSTGVPINQISPMAALMHWATSWCLYCWANISGVSPLWLAGFGSSTLSMMNEGLSLFFYGLGLEVIAYIPSKQEPVSTFDLK